MTQTIKDYPEYLVSTEEREFSWYDYALTTNEKQELWALHGNTYSLAKTLTLRGRLEFRQDYKCIFKVLSHTKGIISSRFFRENDCDWVEVSWLIQTSEAREGIMDHRGDTLQFIEEFINLLRQEHDLHVFIESLAPVNQHDPTGNGNRNGYWSNHY